MRQPDKERKAELLWVVVRGKEPYPHRWVRLKPDLGPVQLSGGNIWTPLRWPLANGTDGQRIKPLIAD